jgi:hypothetical protein
MASEDAKHQLKMPMRFASTTVNVTKTQDHHRPIASRSRTTREPEKLQHELVCPTCSFSQPTSLFSLALSCGGSTLRSSRLGGARRPE